MASRTNRQAARAKILAAFTAQLDRLIPADEAIPLKGATFADFEDPIAHHRGSGWPAQLQRHGGRHNDRPEERG